MLSSFCPATLVKSPEIWKRLPQMRIIVNLAFQVKLKVVPKPGLWAGIHFGEERMSLPNSGEPSNAFAALDRNHCYSVS